MADAKDLISPIMAEFYNAVWDCIISYGNVKLNKSRSFELQGFLVLTLSAIFMEIDVL